MFTQCLLNQFSQWYFEVCKNNSTHSRDEEAETKSLSNLSMVKFEYGNSLMRFLSGILIYWSIGERMKSKKKKKSEVQLLI